MRKCARCETEMIEDCPIRIPGAGQRIAIARNDLYLFTNRVAMLKWAVCPSCGEVSIYIENTKDLD